MPVNRQKDLPPAYSSQASGSAELPIRPTLKPNHSTRASELSRATSEGMYTMSEYLKLTFSVLIWCRDSWEPIVLAIDEDYDTLFDDFHTIFGEPREIAAMSKKPVQRRLTRMRITWGKVGAQGSWPDHHPGSYVKADNLVAMLRLLKSRNGNDYIMVT